MKIEINKDFEKEYKDEFWKGFSGSETLCIAIAVSVAVGVIALCNFKLGISPGTAVYFGVPVAIPVLVLGFFRYQGQDNVISLMRNIYVTYKCRRLSMDMMTGSRSRIFTMKRSEDDGVHADTKEEI